MKFRFVIWFPPLRSSVSLFFLAYIFNGLATFRKHVGEIMCKFADSVVQEVAAECKISAMPTFAFFLNAVEDASMRMLGADVRGLTDKVVAFAAK